MTNESNLKKHWYNTIVSILICKGFDIDIEIDSLIMLSNVSKPCDT